MSCGDRVYPAPDHPMRHPMASEEDKEERVIVGASLLKLIIFVETHRSSTRGVANYTPRHLTSVSLVTLTASHPSFILLFLDFHSSYSSLFLAIIAHLYWYWASSRVSCVQDYIIFHLFVGKHVSISHIVYHGFLIRLFSVIIVTSTSHRRIIVVLSCLANGDCTISRFFGANRWALCYAKTRVGLLHITVCRMS